MSFSGAGLALRTPAADGRLADLIETARPQKLRPRGPAAKRRLARVAFRAALRLVEGEFPPGARPEGWQWHDGDARSTARTIAVHVAAEAFNFRPFQIALGDGVKRVSASCFTKRVWNRRDEDLDFDLRVDALVVKLREIEL